MFIISNCRHCIRACFHYTHSGVCELKNCPWDWFWSICRNRLVEMITMLSNFCFDLCCHCNGLCLVSVWLLLTTSYTHTHSILLFILCLGRCSQTAMKPPLTRSSPKSFFLGKINNTEPLPNTHKHTHKTQHNIPWDKGLGQGYSLAEAALNCVWECVCLCLFCH